MPPAGLQGAGARRLAVGRSLYIDLVVNRVVADAAADLDRIGERNGLAQIHADAGYLLDLIEAQGPFLSLDVGKALAVVPLVLRIDPDGQFLRPAQNRLVVGVASATAGAPSVELDDAVSRRWHDG